LGSFAKVDESVNPANAAATQSAITLPRQVRKPRMLSS
jgi:hypothetical protein